MTPNNPSKPVPLDAETVEAAAKAMRRDAYRYTWGKTFEYERRVDAEAAIHAADEARGMRVERYGDNWDRFPEENHYRLVSDWKPIKGPVDE